MSLIESTATPSMLAARERYQRILREHGDRPITKGPVLVKQLMRGNRGVPGGITDTSFVHPYKGVQINGQLPCDVAVAQGKTPEALFWYMLTGRFPTPDEAVTFQAELANRLEVPGYAWDALDALPTSTHPMTQLQTVTSALEGEAQFRQAYLDGARPEAYWKLMLEDGLNLIAWQHQVGASIYRRSFGDGQRLRPNPDLDWSEQFVYLSGIDDPDGHLTAYLRVYFMSHADHEATNASANAAAVVNSTFATMASTLVAAYSALSGPRHGMANQESLMLIEQVLERFGGVPSESEITQYLEELLDTGRLLPGFGHGQLRDKDIRFVVLTTYLDTIPSVVDGSEIIQCMQQIAKVAPRVLQKRPKIANPNQNIDFGSGAVLSVLGLPEKRFYTVLFSISRMWGVIAQAVSARAEGRPIMRPISLTTSMIEEAATAGPEALDPYFSDDE